jgi:hypothetical protein
MDQTRMRRHGNKGDEPGREKIVVLEFRKVGTGFICEIALTLGSNT